MSEFKNLIAKPAQTTPKRVKPATSKADFKNNPRTKTNEPTALTPQRTSKIAKPGPTKAHAKIHHMRRGASGNHDRRSQEKTLRPVHFKKPQQVSPAKTQRSFRRDLKSRLRAFFTWSRTLTNQPGLKKTADRCVLTSYRRRGASNPSLLSVQRRALRAVEKHTKTNKQRCIRWKKAPVVLTSASARRWRKKNVQTIAYFPRQQSVLLKSFVNMLKGFNERAGKKETALWKAKQAARIASWYVYHYHPFRQRAWLDSTLFKRTQQLKYSLGDTQRLTNALLKKIKKDTAALDANTRPSNITEFFALVNRVRRDLQRWRSQPRSKSKKQKLRSILQQLVQSKGGVVTVEDRVAKLLWLFLTPQIRFKTAVPLSHLRPAARNRKKNLWRKLTPVLSNKAREHVYVNVKQKLHELCSSKNRLRRDVFDKERIYGIEKLKLRLREPRAGHRASSVTRKKVWRRRPRRRQLGKKGRRRVRHKFRRHVGKTRRFRVKTQAVTTVNHPKAQTTKLKRQRVTPSSRAAILVKTTQKSGQARPSNLNFGMHRLPAYGLLCASRVVPLTAKKMAITFSRFHSTLGLTQPAWQRSTQSTKAYISF